MTKSNEMTLQQFASENKIEFNTDVQKNTRRFLRKKMRDNPTKFKRDKNDRWIFVRNSFTHKLLCAKFDVKTS